MNTLYITGDMNMLFKTEHIEMIKKGTKTQTRRNWKRRMVKPGGIYKVKTKMLSKDYHCKIKVISVNKEKLFDMNEDDFIAEGYTDPNEFWDIWEKINGKPENICVYVIDFELYEEKT